MKKQITILSVLASCVIPASAQIVSDYAQFLPPSPTVSFKVNTFAAPVSFTPATVRQIETGSIKLPLQIVPANPTPLTAIQPKVFLVPAAPVPVIVKPSIKPIAPYVAPAIYPALKK